MVEKPTAHRRARKGLKEWAALVAGKLGDVELNTLVLTLNSTKNLRDFYYWLIIYNVRRNPREYKP